MTTLGSNQIDKFKLQIIEKDKIIIDLKQKEKDLNKQITKLNLHLNEKDDQIFRLEDKIQELLQVLKSVEFQNEIKFNKFSENEKNFNLKINDIIIENENLKKQIQNLTAVIEANESSMKNLYIEKQKKDEDIKNLIEELKKKDNMIDINYNKKQILLNENKQLPSLKGKIDDLEKIILELKDEIVGLRDINDKLLEEKNELNNLLNKK
jgi:chromosome segregation ATPase